jgi:hypothetical protein
MNKQEALDALSAAIEDARIAGLEHGVAIGRGQIGQEANELVAKERTRLIAQGVEQGRNQMVEEIEIAREDGRVMGVAEGSALATAAVVEKARLDGEKLGHASGVREGYKKGRGDGYRNGWNDAIAIPASQHKPK